jgi:uncharacterized membrane protein
MNGKIWLKNGVAILVLAALLHVLVVWLVPRAITGAFISRTAKQVGYNTVTLPPLPTDKSRGVVKPSPDLLYAVCVFDVSAGPVRITAKPPEGYWSLALYGRNSDNFFTLNDREIQGDQVELILVSARDTADIAARHPSAILVRPPGNTGLMLARSLVPGPGNIEPVLVARAETRCEALKE